MTTKQFNLAKARKEQKSRAETNQAIILLIMTAAMIGVTVISSIVN